MNRKLLINLSSFIILAVVFGILGWVAESTTAKWAAAAIALALISVGLGINSIIIARHADRRINNIDAGLARVIELQDELQKEQKEQSEQKSSSSQIIPTLQAFSEFYLDYLNKQKESEKNDES